MEPGRIQNQNGFDEKQNKSDEEDYAVNLHLALQGMYSFRQECGFYPESNNPEHIEQVVKLVKEFLQLVKSMSECHWSLGFIFLLLPCNRPKDIGEQEIAM